MVGAAARGEASRTMSTQTSIALDPMARCATRAAADVGDEIARLSQENGRAGTIVGLRQRAQALSRSGFAEDQVLSAAFEAAADDLSWGRPPLTAWLCAMVDPTTVTADARAGVRAGVPAPSYDIASAAEVLVREIEARCARQGEDAFEAARRRTEALAEAQALQASGFDDPRLRVTPALRAVMRCSAERLEGLWRPTPPPVVEPPAAAAVAPRARWPWMDLRRWRAWAAADRRRPPH